MNRDFLVQSQPEIKHNVALQQQWLATNGLAMHGYVQPDARSTGSRSRTTPASSTTSSRTGTSAGSTRTKRGSPRFRVAGLERLGIQRPVNDSARGRITPCGRFPPTATRGEPAQRATAEGWDDRGPFYTQTYISLLGSTARRRVCTRRSSPSTTPAPRRPAGCGGEGRLGSKKAQYVGFWSSMDYWLDNRAR